MLSIPELKDGWRRSFAPIPNFEHFIKRWMEIETEGEAVGLLYAGMIVPPFDDGEWTPSCDDMKAAEIEKRVEFYLMAAMSRNGRVAVTAEQIIVKNLFYMMPPQLMRYEQFARAAMMVFDFLRKPKHSLCNSPFPRFAGEWLEKLHLASYWCDDSSPNPDLTSMTYEQRRNIANTMRNTPGFKKSFVKATCAWGKAYVWATGRIPDTEVASYIKEFLDEENFDPGLPILKISGKAKQLADIPLSPMAEGGPHDVAAKALLRMWFLGDGFSAKLLGRKGKTAQELPK